MNNSKARFHEGRTPVVSLRFMRHLALAALTVLPSLAVQAVGFSTVDIERVGNKDLAVGIWYPSNASIPNSSNTPVKQALAIDAEISVANAPLIVLSHGYGGWMGGHADTALALAEAGFVVAAPSHTGNTYKDMSSSTEQWLLDRPKHVSAVINHLSEQWRYKSVLEDSNVGVFGFSAGGQTALSLIGAIPQFSIAKATCESDPDEFVCREGLIQQMLDADMQSLAASAWGADSRVKAAAIAAPGLGLLYDKQALAGVQVPVQLWSGLEDKRVPHKSNVQHIADTLGTLSENHFIEGAGHFSFMIQSCTEKLKEFEPETWDFLCVDIDGFDRKAFHQQMNSEIAGFFKKHL